MKTIPFEIKRVSVVQSKHNMDKVFITFKEPSPVWGQPDLGATINVPQGMGPKWVRTHLEIDPEVVQG